MKKGQRVEVKHPNNPYFGTIENSFKWKNDTSYIYKKGVDYIVISDDGTRYMVEGRIVHEINTKKNNVMNSKLIQSRINLINARIKQVKKASHLTQPQIEKRVVKLNEQRMSLTKQMEIS